MAHVHLDFVFPRFFLRCVFSACSPTVIACLSFCPVLPTSFTKHLRKKQATEGATTTLHCELSKAAPVEWREGPELLIQSVVSLGQGGAACELELRGLVVVDPVGGVGRRAPRPHWCHG